MSLMQTLIAYFLPYARIDGQLIFDPLYIKAYCARYMLRNTAASLIVVGLADWARVNDEFTWFVFLMSIAAAFATFAGVFAMATLDSWRR